MYTALGRGYLCQKNIIYDKGCKCDICSGILRLADWRHLQIAKVCRGWKFASHHCDEDTSVRWEATLVKMGYNEEMNA